MAAATEIEAHVGDRVAIASNRRRKGTVVSEHKHLLGRCVAVEWANGDVDDHIYVSDLVSA